MDAPEATTTHEPTWLDAALDRSRRDREAAAALQAAVEEQLRRSTSSWPHPPASRGRQL